MSDFLVGRPEQSFHCGHKGKLSRHLLKLMPVPRPLQWDTISSRRRSVIIHQTTQVTDPTSSTSSKALESHPLGPIVASRRSRQWYSGSYRPKASPSIRLEDPTEIRNDHEPLSLAPEIPPSMNPQTDHLPTEGRRHDKKTVTPRWEHSPNAGRMFR